MARRGGWHRRNPDAGALGRVPLAGKNPRGGGLARQPMRVLGSFAAVFLFDGGGWYRDANGVEAAVAPGDLILVFPELAHAYGPDPGGVWGELFVVFHGPVFDLWRSLGLLDAAAPVHPGRRDAGAVAQWRDRFERAWAEAVAARATEAVCAVQASLAAFLGGEPRRAAPPAWIQEARAALDAAETIREPDWHALAARLHVSYETLRKRFAQWTGLSPARYRDRRVVERACGLIEAGWRNQEIAAACGFADAFHFSRRFKAIMGIAPREWRARVGPGTERREDGE